VSRYEGFSPRHPTLDPRLGSNDREILYALATMSRDAVRLQAARSYAEKLATVAPDDPVVAEPLNVRTAGKEMTQKK
jgi:hypothetical protein